MEATRVNMETTRVDGKNLVKNCVYNIYENKGNVNVGVCLVQSNIKHLKLKELQDHGYSSLTFDKSKIYGKIPVDLHDLKLRDTPLIHADLRNANK